MTPSSHDMTDDQALAAALAENAGHRAGDHPQLDELADYLAGALAPADEARVQDHLVACRDCTGQLLDLESLSAPGPQAEGVADLALAAAWREQKTRIADLKNARRRRRTQRWVSAVAASFFVATVGLSVHVGQLRRTIAGLEAPTANVVTAYLEPPTTRSTGDPVTLTVGEGQRLAVFFLTPPRDPSFASYEVEVLDAVGSRVLQISDLELSELDNLRAGIPLERIPAGDYDVRLYGVDGKRREQLQAIKLLVRSE